MQVKRITKQINIDTFFVRAAHYKCASYLRRSLLQLVIRKKPSLLIH